MSFPHLFYIIMTFYFYFGNIIVFFMVLEAMKMENEILAPRDCTVKQVLVNTGAVVDSGAPLVVIG